MCLCVFSFVSDQSSHSPDIPSDVLQCLFLLPSSLCALMRKISPQFRIIAHGGPPQVES